MAIPNVPYHLDRKPGDWKTKHVPKFGWRDDNGKPIHAVKEDGTPCCGYRGCTNSTVCQNGRCALATHGGRHKGAPIQTGKFSIRKAERLQIEAFVHEFCIDFNQIAAAVRIGIPHAKADKLSTRWLKLEDTQELIREKQKARSANCEITAERIREEYRRIAFASPRDVMTWGPAGVTLIDSSELTEEQAAAVAEVSQTISDKGGSIKLKLHDKKGALDSLSRHLGLFDDKATVKINWDAMIGKCETPEQLEALEHVLATIAEDQS